MSSRSGRWAYLELPIALAAPLAMAIGGDVLIVRGIENLAAVSLMAVGFAGCLFVAPIAIVREAERWHRENATSSVAVATIAAVIGVAAWFLVALTVFVNVHIGVGGSL